MSFDRRRKGRRRTTEIESSKIYTRIMVTRNMSKREVKAETADGVQRQTRGETRDNNRAKASIPPGEKKMSKI